MTDLDFEARLRALADQLDYPPTPDIAGRLRASPSPTGRGARGEGYVGPPRFSSKAVAWSLTVSLILLSSLLLIPPVRAAVIEFIQIGIVRIFPQTIEPTSETIITATPGNVAPPTAAPGEPLPLLIPFLDQVAGETKLANAQQIVTYPILLPTHPADLGQPDHVYVQDADGTMTILVWVDPRQPGHVTMSLHFIPAGHWAINKFGPVVIRETEVDGQPAVWTVGPYPLVMRNGDIQVERLVDGHVLIWADEDMTYRLETDSSLEEAIRVAESLQPIP